MRRLPACPLCLAKAHNNGLLIHAATFMTSKLLAEHMVTHGWKMPKRRGT